MASKNSGGREASVVRCCLFRSQPSRAKDEPVDYATLIAADAGESVRSDDLASCLAWRVINPWVLLPSLALLLQFSGLAPHLPLGMVGSRHDG